MAGFIYPRTVAIHRPAAQSGQGALGYGGETQAGETVLFTGLPASIQERREGTKNDPGLPADAAAPTWYVFIPLGALALGSIKNRDIVVDDLENRMQVTADYWDSLGYRLSCLRLEA